MSCASCQVENLKSEEKQSVWSIGANWKLLCCSHRLFLSKLTRARPLQSEPRMGHCSASKVRKALGKRSDKGFPVVIKEGNIPHVFTYDFLRANISSLSSSVIWSVSSLHYYDPSSGIVYWISVSYPLLSGIIQTIHHLSFCGPGSGLAVSQGSGTPKA